MIKNIEKTIHKILDEPFWPDTLNADGSYFRTHDDNDGELAAGTTVAFSPDGDAWLWTTTQSGISCRYRMPFTGGGRSPRVRNALLILAMAIQADNDESPIR